MFSEKKPIGQRVMECYILNSDTKQSKIKQKRLQLRILYPAKLPPTFQVKQNLKKFIAITPGLLKYHCGNI